MLPDCIFCKIIHKQISAKVITEIPSLLVIQDIAPKAKIHYLIIPKKHIHNIAALSTADLALCGEIVLMAQDLAQKLEIKDFRLTSNNGAGAGQSVFHLHFHFLAGAGLPGF